MKAKEHAKAGRLRSYSWGATLFMPIMVAACAASLIARYDPTTDQTASTLKQATISHIDEMEQQSAPACLYDQHRNFYTDQQTKVAALASHVGSLPDNSHSIAEVQELKTALTNFETLHKSASAAGRCQSAAELEPAKSGLVVIFDAIRKLESEKPGAPVTPS